MKYIFWILFFSFAASASFSQVQVRATADKNKILIGEPIKLTLEAYVPLGEGVSWFPTDTLPHFDIIARSAIDTTPSIDGKKVSQVITITSFDSGRWDIPSLELRVDGSAYYTDSIPVDIAYMNFDPNADYRDISTIIEVKNPETGYIPWIIGFFTLIAIGVVIYLLRKRKAIGITSSPIIKHSSFEEAMRALKELKKRRLSDNGAIKEYYTELNQILRRYVSETLHIATFEKTNEEIITLLRDKRLPPDIYKGLSDALRISVFVKFAKYQPMAEDNEQNFVTIKSAIESLNALY